MASTKVLEATNVSKAYGPIKALDDVSFDLSLGEVHALLGHNGAGKSTLVKVLTGLVKSDEGEFFVSGEPVDLKNPKTAQEVGISWVDQELSLVPTLSVEDNIALGDFKSSMIVKRRKNRPKIRILLDRIGLAHVSPTQLVGSLSIGERQLVEIARALNRDAKILILDEPTATLSDHEIGVVFEAIREITSTGTSVIYVSHRLEEILQLCQRATIFRDGRLITTENVADLDHAKLVELMIGQLPELKIPEQTFGEKVRDHVSIKGLIVGEQVRDFNLDVGRGEIIGIAGQVGSGASSMLRAIAGLETMATGQVSIAQKQLKLGSAVRSLRSGALFVSNDRKGEGLYLSMSNGGNLTATRLDQLSRYYYLSRSRLRATARRLLGTAGIDVKRQRAPTETLSGGNQQKVFIGRNLEHPLMEVLLLDEPTRGVDVGGRAEIHQLIREAAANGCSVIFASTELDEILDLSDSVLTMRKGRMVSLRNRSEVTAAGIFHEMTQDVTEETSV